MYILTLYLYSDAAYFAVDRIQPFFLLPDIFFSLRDLLLIEGVCFACALKAGMDLSLIGKD